MGFKEAKAAVLKALAEGTYHHESRHVGKNWLADDRLTVTEAIEIISGCRGSEASCTPHHFNPQQEVWVLTPARWYIKFYLVEEVWFISFHSKEPRA